MLRSTHLSALSGVLLTIMTATAVDAASIRITCEQRTNRSKISVDGKDLVPGDYSAVVMSGSNTAQSPVQSSVGDEAEFDFSSQTRDIAAGATAIARNFIQGGTVTAKLMQDDFTVLSDTVACRVR